MTIFQTDRGAGRAVPWLAFVLLNVCLPIIANAQVLDDFESGPLSLGGTTYDLGSQSGLLPIPPATSPTHCERSSTRGGTTTLLAVRPTIARVSQHGRRRASWMI